MCYAPPPPRTETEIMNLLIEKLREKAEETSQHQVARDIGVTAVMVNYMLQGERTPGPKTLRGIVKAYPELTRYAWFFLLEKYLKQNGSNPVPNS